MNLDPLAILNALPEAALLRDAEGVVRHVNPAAERLLDMRAADVVGGRDLPHISTEQLAEGGSRFDIYLNYRRCFAVNIVPCGSDGLESNASLVVYRDMTAMRDLYLSVYYNLRGFMTPVRGFTQLLAMEAAGPLSDKQKELADLAANNSKKMSAYMQTVLDWATIARQHEIVLNTKPIDINDLITDAFESLHQQQWILERENMQIFGDRQKLFVVFRMLKFQASYDDANALIIETRSQSGRITIEIKIEGSVYEPLWAFGPRALCERILAAHGGRFELDASNYESCACTITLPITSESAAP